METILSVSHKVLGSLTAEAAVKQFRNLLWCEAVSIGLPLNKIVVSLDTAVSDGGIDAKVEGVPKTASLLVHGNCYFQIKTGTSFKPWQISSLKKELFGRTTVKPAKSLLGSGVKSCLDGKGKYVVIAYGSDLTAIQHSQARQHLENILSACGYKNPIVDILGQGQLVGLFSKYPSLCLEILGKADYAFQTVDSWKSNEDMTSRLQLADPQKKFIEDLRSVIRGSEYQHVRVIGEPGIGKTRLILEALLQDDLSPLVVNGGRLVAAITTDRILGRSLSSAAGRNYYELLGSGMELKAAFRRGAFGTTRKPFVGYLILLEDAPAFRTPVKDISPNFPIFPEF